MSKTWKSVKNMKIIVNEKYHGFVMTTCFCILRQKRSWFRDDDVFLHFTSKKRSWFRDDDVFLHFPVINVVPTKKTLSQERALTEGGVGFNVGLKVAPFQPLRLLHGIVYWSLSAFIRFIVSHCFYLMYICFLLGSIDSYWLCTNCYVFLLIMINLLLIYVGCCELYWFVIDLYMCLIVFIKYYWFAT